jgi:hypothetical protein
MLKDGDSPIPGIYRKEDGDIIADSTVTIRASRWQAI